MARPGEDVGGEDGLGASDGPGCGDDLRQRRPSDGASALRHLPVPEGSGGDVRGRRPGHRRRAAPGRRSRRRLREPLGLRPLHLLRRRRVPPPRRRQAGPHAVP